MCNSDLRHAPGSFGAALPAHGQELAEPGFWLETIRANLMAGRLGQVGGRAKAASERDAAVGNASTASGQQGAHTTTSSGKVNSDRVQCRRDRELSVQHSIRRIRTFRGCTSGREQGAAEAASLRNCLARSVQDGKGGPVMASAGPEVQTNPTIACRDTPESGRTVPTPDCAHPVRPPHFPRHRRCQARI